MNIFLLVVLGLVTSAAHGTERAIDRLVAVQELKGTLNDELETLRTQTAAAKDRLALIEGQEGLDPETKRELLEQASDEVQRLEQLVRAKDARIGELNETLGGLLALLTPTRISYAEVTDGLQTLQIPSQYVVERGSFSEEQVGTIHSAFQAWEPVLSRILQEDFRFEYLGTKSGDSSAKNDEVIFVHALRSERDRNPVESFLRVGSDPLGNRALFHLGGPDIGIPKSGMHSEARHGEVSAMITPCLKSELIFSIGQIYGLTREAGFELVCTDEQGENFPSASQEALVSRFLTEIPNYRNSLDWSSRARHERDGVEGGEE